MLRSTGFIVAAMAIGIAVLSALGVWQLHRLAWKEALIARIESRIEQPPGTIGDLSRLWRETGDVAYVPTRVTGTFLHDGEMLFYTTYKGAVGWDVLTPMRLADGTILIVDRGFVPIDRADPATRSAQPATRAASRAIASARRAALASAGPRIHRTSSLGV